MSAYEPSAWESFSGLFNDSATNRARASNEVAARRIAQREDVSPDRVYDSVGGSRPMLNPEGRPLSQSVPEVAGVIASEVPRIIPGATNAALGAIRGGTVPAIDESLIDRGIAATGKASSAPIDPNYDKLSGLGQSLGYSGTTMAGAVVGSALGASVGGPLGGYAGGAAASGAIAYRGQKNDFLRRVRDDLNQKRQAQGLAPMNADEWGQAAADADSAATKYGLWEAVPEAVSNLVFLKALHGASPLKEVILSSPAEHGTETITGVGQNRADIEAGLSNEEMTIADAFKQQFFQTLILTGALGSSGAIKEQAHKFYTDKVEPSVSPQSALGRAMQDQLVGKSFNPDAINQQVIDSLSPPQSQSDRSPIQGAKQVRAPGQIGDIPLLEAGRAPGPLGRASAAATQQAAAQVIPPPVALPPDPEFDDTGLAGPMRPAGQVVPIDPFPAPLGEMPPAPSQPIPINQEPPSGKEVSSPPVPTEGQTQVKGSAPQAADAQGQEAGLLGENVSPDQPEGRGLKRPTPVVGASAPVTQPKVTPDGSTAGPTDAGMVPGATVPSAGTPNAPIAPGAETQPAAAAQPSGAPAVTADDEPLLKAAIAHVTTTGDASVSGVQRALNIGFTHASRLVEKMQRSGVVSPPSADGKRQVLTQAPVTPPTGPSPEQGATSTPGETNGQGQGKETAEVLGTPGSEATPVPASSGFKVKNLRTGKFLRDAITKKDAVFQDQEHAQKIADNSERDSHLDAKATNNVRLSKFAVVDLSAQETIAPDAGKTPSPETISPAATRAPGAETPTPAAAATGQGAEPTAPTNESTAASPEPPAGKSKAYRDGWQDRVDGKSAPTGKTPPHRSGWAAADKAMVAAASPPSADQGATETPAWHTPIPAEGLAVEPGELRAGKAREVVARVAADAYDAASRDQLTSGAALYLHVLPSTEARHGMARLLPEDQAVPAGWHLVNGKSHRIGMMTRQAAVVDIIKELSSEPILARGEEPTVTKSGVVVPAKADTKAPYITAPDLAEHYKATGLSRAQAWDQYVKDSIIQKSLRTDEVNAKDFNRFYDALEPGTARPSRLYPGQKKAPAPSAPKPETPKYRVGSIVVGETGDIGRVTAVDEDGSVDIDYGDVTAYLQNPKRIATEAELVADNQRRAKEKRASATQLRKEAADFNKSTGGEAVRDKRKVITVPSRMGGGVDIIPFSHNVAGAHHKTLLDAADKLNKEADALDPPKGPPSNVKLQIKTIKTKSFPGGSQNGMSVTNIPQRTLDALGWKGVWFKPGMPQTVYAQTGTVPSETSDEVIFVGEVGKGLIAEINRRIDGGTETPAAKGETPANAELERLNLLREFNGKWQYRTAGFQGSLGPWHTSNTKEGAVEMAVKFYQQMPEADRLGPEERAAKGNADAFAQSDRRWKHLSLDQLRTMHEEMGEALPSLRKQAEREFNGGGRRTGPAVAAQGARDTAETRMQLGIYIAEREAKETPAAKTEPTPATLDVNQVLDLATKEVGDESMFEVFENLDEKAQSWPRGAVLAAINKVKQSGRAVTRAKAAEALLKANGGQYIGMEVKNAERDQWAFILPDASEPGKFRSQRFDARGFFSHSTQDTEQQVLDELVADGFTEHAPGALDRLSSTPQWTAGMEATAAVQKFNQESSARSQAAKGETKAPAAEKPTKTKKQRALDDGEFIPIEEDPRLQDPQIMAIVKQMLAMAGHTEQGGRRLRDDMAPGESPTTSWLANDIGWMDRPSNVKMADVASLRRKLSEPGQLSLNKAERSALRWYVDDVSKSLNDEGISWDALDDGLKQRDTPPTVSRAVELVNLGVKALGRDAFDVLEGQVTDDNPGATSEEFLSALEVAINERINRGKTSDHQTGDGNLRLDQAGPTLELTGQTDDELRADASAAKLRADQDAESARRAEVDRNRGEFVLTGSTRPADEAAARGQADLFDQISEEIATQPESTLDAILPPAPGETQDMDALFDALLDEESAAILGTPKEKPARKPRAPRKPSTAPKSPRTAGAATASAVKNAVSGMDKAVEGLAELFGGNKLSSGLTFDEDTYAKAKPLFMAAASDFKNAAADIAEIMRALIRKFLQTTGNKDAVAKMKPYILRFVEDVQDGTIQLGETDVSTAGEDAPGTGDAGQGPADQGAFDAPGTGVTAGTGRDGAKTADQGAGVASDRRVPGARSPVVGERGRTRLSSADGRLGHRGGTSRPGYGGRGTERGAGGLPAESATATPTTQAAVGSSRPVNRSKSDKLPVKSNDLENIRATLPQLLPSQQDDVKFAEERFANGGRGVLFTNGTGTGKTFTALGIIARSIRQGLGNIIITAPGESVINSWVRAARDHFGIEIHKLADTNDAGPAGSVTITTYANFYQNTALIGKQWDMVVHDEAHKLMENAAGESTGALDMSRVLTGHPRGAYAYASMMEAPLLAEIGALDFDAKLARTSDDERQWGEADGLQAKADAKRRIWEAKQREHIANRAALWDAKTTKRLDLSATPFAYETSVDMAEGFLFDYGPANTSGRYNTPDPHGDFMIQHFGYRMRIGKLTKPDAKVDSSVMQRAFNRWLKQTGALSGRALDVDFDYSREFVAVSDLIGNKIDEGMQYIQDRAHNKDDPMQAAYREYLDEINDRFDYHARIRLLEAIKAPYAVKRAKQHIAMGRKVVIFHSRIQGGSVHPFAFDGVTSGMLEKATADFKLNKPDIYGMDLGALYRPLDLFAREFGDRVTFYNGTVNKKGKVNNPVDFNIDNELGGKYDVIVVQDEGGKEGISLHDTTGKHQRALINIGLPVKPTQAIQIEGRTYRVGQQSDAIFEYFNTGTSFERWTFASKISERASTAENLAMGDSARRLRDAFVDAFEDPTNGPPNANQGKGGKESDKALENALTPFQEAKTHYFGNQKNTKSRGSREGVDYFATPEPLGVKMVEWAGMRPGDAALEPSAGHGAIARYFPGDVRGMFVEPSGELASRLALRASGTIRNQRFEDLDEGANKFDTIVMNPPYGSGGKTAAEHVAKAMNHLKNGGRIVALVPEGTAATKRFEELLYGRDKNGSAELVGLRELLKSAKKSGEGSGPIQQRINQLTNFHVRAEIGLPSVTFERAGTAVKTRILIIDRVDADSAKGREISQRSRLDIGDEDINGFFDSIENQTAPDRLTGLVSSADVLTNFGLHVQQALADNFILTGKTYDHRDAIGPVMRKHGGNWSSTSKAWTAKSDPTEDLANALQGLPVEGLVEESSAAPSGPVPAGLVEHVTAKGKTLRGVVRTDLSQAAAKAIDKFTFKKNGGWFIREQHLEALKAADQFAGYAPSDEAPRFSLSPSGKAQSVTPEEINTAIAPLVNAWERKVPVVVAPNITDARVPQAIRDAFDAQKSESSTGDVADGVFYRGVVYLFSDSLPSVERAQEVLMHEAFGHLGLRGAFGPALVPILRQIVQARRQEVRAKAIDYRLDPNSNNDLLHAAEEVLADLAATNPQFGFVRRAIAAIRAFLRQHGVKLKLSDNDIIAQFIIPARKYVEGKASQRRGVSGVNAGGARFSTGRSDAGESTADGIADVMRAWDARGIENFLSEKNGIITVHKIVVPKDRRSNGMGTAAMGELIAYADRTEQQIALTPSPDFGGNKRRLSTFYRGLGFRPYKGYAVRETMIRDPKPIAPGRAGQPSKVSGQFNESAYRPAVVSWAKNRFRDQRAPDGSLAWQNFVRWYGNSVVTNPDGTPRVVYHGSRYVEGDDARTTFTPTRGDLGTGIYFTTEPDEASDYANDFDRREIRDRAHVIPVYLKIESPHEWTKEDRSADDADKRQAAIKKRSSVDGLVRSWQSSEQKHYVAFDSSQVKSAVGNDGSFSPAPDIRFSLGAKPTAVSAKMNLKRNPITGKPDFSVLDADGKVVGRILTEVTADEAVARFNTAPSPTVAAPTLEVSPAQEQAPKDARSNWKIWTGTVEQGSEPDDYYYHVTSYPVARRIIREGLDPMASGMFTAGMYPAYSKGKAFVTERNGVEFWKERVAAQLADASDRPAAVAVVRIPKSKAPTLLPDVSGTTDARVDAYYSNVRFSRKPSTDPVLTEARRRIGQGPSRGFVDSMNSALGRVWDAIGRDRQEHLDNARQSNLDQFHGIRVAARRNFGNLPVEQDPYITARLSNGIGSVMRAVLMHGQPQWSANEQHLEKKAGTEGLLDILRPLGNDLDDWLGWMAGNRAARLLKEGRERNLKPEHIQALQALGKARIKEFREAATKFAAFKRSILDVAQQAGIIDPASRAAWDYADWIPFYRVLAEQDQTLAPRSHRGLAGQSSGIRTLHGGESATNDLLENIILNFHHLLDASLKNNAVRKAVEFAPDAAEKLPPPMAQAAVPNSEIKRILKSQGMTPDIADLLPPDVFEGISKMWSFSKPTDPTAIRIMEGGKAAYYKITDPLLLKAVSSFEQFDFPGLGVARAFKRLLTGSVTATPAFMLRNFIRDTFSTAIISKEAVSSLGAFNGVVKAYRETGGAEDMMFAGASFASGYIEGSDPESVSRAVRRALRDRGFSAASADQFIGSVIDTSAKLWDGYRKIGEAVENANREASFEAVRKAGRSVTAAAFEAKDMMDFSLRGSGAAYQLIADVIPFFNARVQGMYRLGRTDPKTLAVRSALMLVLPSVLLALVNLGNDRYKELPDWDKDTYWHFFVGDQHFRIPKPFELGLVGATYVERAINYAAGNDDGKKALGRVLWGLSDNLNLAQWPQVIKPLVELGFNQDSFRQTPIENMGDAGKLPSARYDARTSDTLREIIAAGAPVADAIGLSPKRAEHLVSGYLGSVGSLILSIMDAGTRKLVGASDQPAMRTDEIPLLSVLYRGNGDAPPRTTQYAEDVYKAARAFTEVHNTINAKRKEGGDPDGLRALIESHRDVLTIGGLADPVATRITEIGKEINKVSASRTLTPEQKRSRIDLLYGKRNTVARHGVEAMKQAQERLP